MYALAVVTGSIAGSLHDPVFWLCLVAAVAAGMSNRPPAFILAVAIVSAALRAGISTWNRLSMDLPPSPIMGWSALGTMISVLAVGFIVVLIRRLRKPPSP